MIDFTTPVLPFSFAKNWTKKLIIELGKKRTDREKQIDYIADIFGDPFILSEFYIEPDCQQFNPADEVGEDDVSIVRQPVFSRLEQFFTGKIITSSPHLLILADSGMGKTSVLMMLALGYINSFWPKKYECILFQLGIDTLEKIKSIDGRRKKILLLDALDEDRCAFDRIPPRLLELLQATKTFYRVIITCRTQFFTGSDDPFNRRGKVAVGDYIFPVIYMSLFSEKQVMAYLKKRFPSNREKRMKAINIIMKMRSLRSRPILLAHIEDILESKNKDWTEYTVYKSLVNKWLSREHDKMSRILKFKRKSPTVEELWNACRDIAVYLHLKELRHFEENKFISYFTSNREFKDLSTFDIGGRSLLNKDSHGQFRFSHYSIQEFLIAHAIITGTTNTKLENVRITDQLIVFLLSWLSTQPKDVRQLSILKKLDLEGANLSNSDLEFIDLKEGNLCSSNLEFSKLKNACLDRANLMKTEAFSIELQGASLQFTNFSYSNLKCADISCCKARNTNFENAILNEIKADKVNFEGSNMTGIKAKRAKIANSFLNKSIATGACFDESTLVNNIFDGSNLTETSFIEAELNSCSLINCEANNSIMKKSIIENCDFTDSGFKGADFSGAKLINTNMQKSNLSNANFLGALVAEIKFNRANLTNATLKNANIKGANFAGANLKRANLSGANLESSNLSDALMQETNLKGTNLLNANLSNANLNKANLSDANLKGADLSGAILDNIIFDNDTKWPDGFSQNRLRLLMRRFKD